MCTVMILSFQTDTLGQTVQTQIRMLLEKQSDQGLHCLPFHLHRLDSFLYGGVIVQILEWLQQIFWVSEYLGNLRYLDGGNLIITLPQGMNRRDMTLINNNTQYMYIKYHSRVEIQVTRS